MTKATVDPALKYAPVVMLIKPKAISAGGLAQQRAQSVMKPAPYFATLAFPELFAFEQPHV
jgi:hypothetical protein